MARPLRSRPGSRRPAASAAKARGGRPGAKSRPGEKRPGGAERDGKQGHPSPRAGAQLVVWTLVLTVFGGLAMLSGQAEGFMSGKDTPQASASSASSAPAASAAQAQAGADGRLMALPMDPEDSANPETAACDTYDERRDYLPLHRWTSFELFVVDNARIFKTQLFVSMISSLMFMAAALAWRIIGTLMGFGYTFNMICQADNEINSVALTFTKYASWFLIPAWLWVLMAVIKRWTGGGRRGAASGMRLIAVFLVATGMIFFINKESARAEKPGQDPLQAHTMPWMAKEVQGWFGAASDSLYDLQRIGRTDSDEKFTDGTEEKNPLFYDNSGGGVGPITCAKLDETLYNSYIAANKDSSLRDGKQALVQVSKIWEMSLVRSYQAAQFGEGTEKYPSPAHASCRWLEANAEVPAKSKYLAYDRAAGHEVDEPITHAGMMRGYFIAPPTDEQSIMVAWGACRGPDNGHGGDDEEGQTIDQWKDVVENDKEACRMLYSSDVEAPDQSSGLNLLGLCYLCDDGAVGAFYFNGDDELKDKIGSCYTVDAKCRYDWNFVAAWLGKNQAERLTQGLMSMVVGFIFLFVMGPMAVGMTVASVGLAALVMIMPLTLLFIAAGLPQGKRILKLTGAAAAGEFLFTMGLTFLMMLTDTAYRAIGATIGSDTPNFFEQVAQGAAPLVALYLFRKISRILGVGNISSTTGATGFATAIVLKSSGDRQLSRNPGELVSNRLKRVGVGKARLGALDEKSLQRRMLNNRATRATAGAAGRGLKRAAQPLTDKAKDGLESASAWLHKRGDSLMHGVDNLKEKAKSGSPKERAAAYAGLTGVLAGLPMLAPPAVLATLPLMSLTGAAALGQGGQAVWRRAKPHIGADSGLITGAPAGMPLADSARTAVREADDWHRNIMRVSDPEDRRNLITGRTRHALDTLRAAQWGIKDDDAAFMGFADDEQKETARAEMASAMGLKPDQIMMGDHGIAIPRPPEVGKNGQLIYPENYTVEDAKKNPFIFFDAKTLQRQPGETQDQKIVKLVTQAVERGAMTANGEVVDVLAAHGFDTRSPEVRERVELFFAGGKDQELSRIVTAPRRVETTAIKASHDWDSAQSVPLGPVNTMLDVADAARRDTVGDFHDIRINSGSAGDARNQFKEGADELRRAIMELRDLADVTALGTGDDFMVDPSRLISEKQQSATRVEQMCAQLRDAFDASSAARSVCELRLQTSGTGAAVDVEEFTRMADQLTTRTQNTQREFHEDIERLLGAVSRPQDGANDSASMLRAIDDLERLLSQRISREQQDRREVADRMEDLERSLQKSRHMKQTDPRLSSRQPVVMRQELEDQARRDQAMRDMHNQSMTGM